MELNWYKMDDAKWYLTIVKCHQSTEINNEELFRQKRWRVFWTSSISERLVGARSKSNYDFPRCIISIRSTVNFIVCETKVNVDGSKWNRKQNFNIFSAWKFRKFSSILILFFFLFLFCLVIRWPMIVHSVFNLSEINMWFRLET